MQRYWLAFARTGAPVVAGLPNWPRFSADAPRALHLDTTIAAGEPVNARALAFHQARYGRIAHTAW